MNEKGLSYCLIEETLIKKLMNDINYPEFDANASDDSGKTLLHVACQLGMAKLVEGLIQHGAQINLKDCFGRTPVMLACFAGYENIVDILISHNADINFNDFYGFNVLTLAVYGGCNMVKYFFNKYNPISNNNYLGIMPVLALACSIGNEELVNFILSQEPEQVNVPIEKTGMTPLMLAICGGYTKVSKLLIKYGASCRMISKASFSAICYALKLSFPVLELKIPELTLNDQSNQLCPDKLPKHPLTPNLYLSPEKNVSSPRKCLHRFKKLMKVKRSKSLDCKKKNKFNNSDKDDINSLKSIFQIAKLQQYWPIFKEQQINFRTFLTMDEEDLCCIGINKLSVRNKFLTLIEHYNHIFYL